MIPAKILSEKARWFL